MTLEWITVDPKQAGAENKRRVRSHVTRLQHAPGGSLVEKTRDPQSGKFARRRRKTAEGSQDDGQDEGEVEEVPRQSSDIAKMDLSRIEQYDRETKPDPEDTMPGSRLATQFSTGAFAVRTFFLHDPDNTVGICLAKLSMSLPAILATYEDMVKFQSRDFESTMGVKIGSACPVFLEFIYPEPVLVMTAITIAVRWLLGSARVSRPQSRVHLLQLRGALISALNRALSNPVRGLTGKMLVAVSLCSAFELVDGNAQGYIAHVNGLAKMIELRGGLTRVGELDAILERFLVWHMTNTAKAANSTFPEAVLKSSRLKIPKPDEDMFRLKGVEGGTGEARTGPKVS